MTVEPHSYTDAELLRVLERSQTIAVVGMSTDPAKPSHTVPKMLIKRGFTVIPVNPTTDEILGQRSYPTLADIPVHVDIVDVFRPGPKTPEYADKAAEIGADTLWLQLGISNEETKARAEAHGLQYFENICIGETVHRLNYRKTQPDDSTPDES